MRKFFSNAISAITVLALMTVAGPVSADLIGFEDLPNNTQSFVPTSYHGLTWGGGGGSTSWVVDQQTQNVFSGTDVHSGVNYAWSNGGTDLSISSATTFTMDSLWARIGFLPSGTAVAHGFVGNTEVYTQTLSLTDSYQFFALNFVGINSWTLTNQTINVLIDDISINGGSPVPEPSTFALLGLGGLGLACGAIRRRRAAF